MTSAIPPAALPLPLGGPFRIAEHQKLVKRSGVAGLLLTLTLVISSAPAALACGGGGSGSYRKPPRPGQQLHNSALHSQTLSAPGESKNSERN